MSPTVLIPCAHAKDYLGRPSYINLNYYITHGIKALTAWACGPSVYKTTKRCVSESIHGKLSKHKSPLRFTYVFTGQRAIADRVLLNRRSRLYGRRGRREGKGEGIHIYKATNGFFCVVIIRFYLDLPIARKGRKVERESTCPKLIRNMLSSYLKIVIFIKTNNTREIYRIENSSSYLFPYFLSLLCDVITKYTCFELVQHIIRLIRKIYFDRLMQSDRIELLFRIFLRNSNVKNNRRK